MAGRAPPPGHAVKLPVTLYAEAVLMAQARGRTVGQYVETALAAYLERDRQTLKVDHFRLAQRDAIRARSTSPAPEDYGLPRDYGIPPHP